MTSPLDSLRAHGPEYLIEGVLLGLFMIAACVAVVVVEHPASRVRRRIRSALARRAIIGGGMGLTAIALIFSPWGQRSGAHMNPAVTLAFAAMGKVEAWDGVFYVLAQFVGAVAGVALARAAIGRAVAHPDVAHVVTRPGPRGRRAAWIGEAAISFILFLSALVLSNRPSTAPYAGLAAGALVALFITFEAPLSGMSMNPARTLGSSVVARDFRALWVYFTAPPAAMLLAALVFSTGALGSGGAALCAKWRHPDSGACLFRCRHAEVLRHEATPGR